MLNIQVVTAEYGSWVIDGDTVYVNDSKVFASATPHTVYGSSWVEFVFRSKNYSGDVDFIWGFNTSYVRPRSPLLWWNYTHYYEGSHYVQKWGCKTFYNVTGFVNLGIENYSNYTVDYGNENNTRLYNVTFENGSANATVAFTTFSHTGDDYTVCGNYTALEDFVWEKSFWDWKPFQGSFDVVDYSYGNMSRWYILAGVDITANVTYKLKAWLEVLPCSRGDGKYWWGFKPSSETLQEAIANGHLYAIDPWWDSSWGYKKQITLDSSQIPSDLNNFPVLINITDADLASHAQSDGDDIVFVDSSETIVFNHEIELYNGSNGRLIAWVNITSLSSSSDTVLYMYYGNPSCSSQENPSGVWDSNYLCVFHMDDYDSSAVKDSTGNVSGNKVGSNEPVETAGVVGYAQNFDGSNDYITINKYLHISSSGTWEFYVKLPSTSESGGFLSKRDGGSTNNWQFYPDDTYGDRLNSNFWHGTTGTTALSSSGFFSANNWVYTVCSFDGSNRRYYKNGNLFDTISSAFTLNDDNIYTRMGDDWYGHHPSMVLDEVRVSNIVRTGDWITTTYNTINNASDGGFFTLGSEQSIPVNHDPSQSGVSPGDGSTNIDLTPSLHVVCTDVDGDTMNATWWSNSSGSWVQFASNNSIANNTNITQTNNNFSSYNTKYWWSVNLSDGEGGWNNQTYSFTTRNQYTPDPPSSFIAVTISTSQIDLSWSKGSSNVDTTIVERNTVSSWSRGNGVEIYNSTGTTYSDTGLNHHTTYYYQAWSYNITDNVYSSSVSTSNTTDNNIPVVNNPNPGNGSTGQPLSFTWSISISDNDGDTFNWSIECSNGQSNNANNENNGTKSLSLSGLGYKTNYTVWVNVTDGYDNVNNSYWFITRDKYYPDPPNSFTVTTVNRSVITLNWVKGSDADKTYIRYKQGSTPPVDRTDGIFLYNDTGSSTSVSGLSFNTQYSFKAWSYNITDNVYSNNSVSGTNTTLSNQLPILNNPNPGNNSNNIAITLSQLSIDLSDTEGDKMNWSIETSPNIGSNSGSLEGNGSKTCSVSGLQPSTTYHWYVNVTDSYSNVNNSYIFTTASNSPPSYSNPNPGNGSTGQPLSLTWNITIVDAEGDTFNWSIECSNGQSNSDNNDVNGSKSLSLSGLNYNTNYTIWVNSTDGYSWNNATFWFITRNQYVPDPPSGFTVTAYNMTRIDLSWSKGSDADTTYIERNTTEGWSRGEGTEVYNSTGTTYSDTGLSPGTTYYYQAWSYNITDNVYSSSYSSGNDTTTNTLPTVTNIYPSNGSDANTQPTCHITVTDSDGDTMTVYWYENTTGSWVLQQTNNSVSSGSTVYWVYNNASNVSNTYYWKIIVNDTHDSISKTYHFSVDPWWNNNWNYYITYRIDHTKINNNLSNYPVLVKINDTIADKCDNGKSIRFLSNDNSTMYNYEIEKWVDGEDRIIWVNITNVSSTSDTIFYMYYNNSNATDNQNPADVWDTHYLCVYHMKDNTSTLIKDSTNNINGSKKGSNEPSQVTGIVGYAQNFDGVDDYIQIMKYLHISTAGTWEFYIKLPSTSESGGILSKRSGTSNNDWHIYPDDTDGSKLSSNFWHSGTGDVYTSSSGFFSANNWVYTVITFTGNDKRTYYKNGIEYSNNSDSFTLDDHDYYTRMGHDWGTNYLNMILDEIRISDIVRSSAYINATYTNINNYDSMISTGTVNPRIGFTASNPYPNNLSNVSLHPTCHVTISNDAGLPMNITFSSNYTGSWVNYQTNSSVYNGTYSWNFSGADTYETKYYWRIYVTYDDFEITRTYSFNTTWYVHPPYDFNYTINSSNNMLNFSWKRGLHSDQDVVVKSTTEYPTNVTDGTIVQNSTKTYYNETINNFVYYSIFGYNSTQDLYSEPLHATWGGVNIYVYKENEPWVSIGNYTVFITNVEGTETYMNSRANNPFRIDVSDVPHGEDIIIQISKQGYETHSQVMDLFENTWYVVEFYLPPSTSGSPSSEEGEPWYVPPSSEKTELKTNTTSVSNPDNDVTVVLECAPEKIVSVYGYNESLYGHWFEIPSDKYTVNGNTVVVDSSMLDENTTLVKVSYYCTVAEEYASQYLFSVVGAQSEYGSNIPIDGAYVVIKRYFNNTGSYETIYSVYTDSNGQVSVWLVPGVLYQVTISKTGYETEIILLEPRTIQYADDWKYTFRLSRSSGTWEEPEYLMKNITWSVEPLAPIHYGSFTIWFNITSSDNKLEWFSMRVLYYNTTNNTWVVLFYNKTYSSSGGSINYTIPNVTGRYSIECWFKKQGYDPYEVLQEGSLVTFIEKAKQSLESFPDFAYFVVLLIIMIMVMGFFMIYFSTGILTGYIGLGVMAIGLLMKGVTIGGVSGWMIFFVTFVLYTMGVFLWSRL